MSRGRWLFLGQKIRGGAPLPKPEPKPLDYPPAAKPVCDPPEPPKPPTINEIRMSGWRRFCPTEFHGWENALQCFAKLWDFLPNCPKCGHYEIRRVYDKPHYHPFGPCVNTGRDHLDNTCEKCGFAWISKFKDEN